MYSLGLILLLVISLQCGFAENSENVPKYIVRRLRETKVEIAKAFIQRDTVPVITSSYDTQWEKLWSENLHSERTLMVRTFNKMCILEGNRVISVAVKPATNETNSALQEVSLIRQDRPVKFVKSIFWKSKLYLLVCYVDDNACGLYTGNNELQLKHKQIIKDKGWPMDAIFFTRENRLYLVVAYNTDQFPVSSIIYHWTGTYMDVIHPLLMVGVVSVTAFNYKNSTIIIFGQNEQRQPDIGSLVYKFDDNSITTIQYLQTNGPISIHYYTYEEQIFLMVINEKEASNVYWWDGNEFLHWTDLPDIVAPIMINVAHFSGDTLFFVAHESHVSVYKASSSTYLRLNLLQLKNKERVVDMAVWTDEKSTLTLLLITVDLKNLYRIETWELRMKKKPEHANLKEAEEATERCLGDLESRLNERVDPMEKLTRKTWPMLLPSAKNINIGALNGSNRLEKLILHSGSIAKLDVFSSGRILLASEIESLAESWSPGGGSETIVNSILEESRKTMKIHGVNRLVGDVIIEGDAVFQGLKINAIHTEILNGQSINLTKSVISKMKNQIFHKEQLYGKNISVQELEIDGLCGIPHPYWLRKSNEKSENIFLKDNIIDIINDTIFLKTDLLTLNHLNLRSIDGVELSSFFKDIFIPGKKQSIKGNIIQNQSEIIKIGDLVVENLNGVPRRDLMTIHKNQSLENNVFVKTMLIQNLVAKKVNGVNVSESAMVSKKNHIKGDVVLASLRILDELVIDNPSTFSEVRPVQFYEDVTIIGNIKLENVVMEPFTNFGISLKNGSTIEKINIDFILDAYWRKSTSQIIENKIYFDAGLTVDQLTIEYLNNLNINQDVMLTNLKEIDDSFSSLEFINFAMSGWIIEEMENPHSTSLLWTSTNETLFVNQEIKIERLGAQYLNVEAFNGIPLSEIMKKKSIISGPYKYPVDSIQRFDTVTVKEFLETNDLDLRFFNDQKEIKLQDLLQFDANYNMKYLKAETLTLEDIVFFSETENETQLHKFAANYLQEFTNTSKLDPNEEFSLIIDDHLEVENDLKVDVINHQSTETYLEDLASQDFLVSSDEHLIIDKLVVHQNLNVQFIHGSKIETLIQNILSKSRVQNLTNSRFSFHKISVDDLRTERINKRLTSNFVYTDSYDIQFNGDVTFTDLILSLDEDTQTKSLNGYQLDTIYNQLGEINLLSIKDLTVKGNVSWESGGWSLAGSQLQLGPLDTIIKNTLIKSTEKASKSPQIINGQLRINSPREESPGVSVRWMKYNYSNHTDNSFKFPEGLQSIDMKNIVYDAVLDDPSNDKEIKIVGKKNFVQDLRASRLNVAGEIGIDSLNNWNINYLNASIVRKESLNMLINEEKFRRNFKDRASRNDNQRGNLMIFRDDVSIRKLVIQPNVEVSSVPEIHGVPVTAIFLSSMMASGKYLPNNTYIKHLEIQGDAFVKSLDNVDFDEFVNNRVSINSNHQIQGNLQFNGRVQVSQGAKIRTINGILPSEFAINNSKEDEIIFGEKTFYGDLQVKGNTYAPSIGGIKFIEEYSNAVLNYQDTDIFGDIIFKADIDRPFDDIKSTTRLRLNSATGGLVNGIRLKSFINDRDMEEENILRGLKRNESRLELSVVRSLNASSQLPEIFYYFESVDDLAIDVADVNRVEVVKIEQLTILNLYANELSSYCGLKKNCPCRRQYVAEITQNNCQSHEIEGTRIVYNFHEPRGTFGITVATNTVSSSKICTTEGKNSSFEYTTISWMKKNSGNLLGEKITENAHKIYGYLSDVRVFTQNDLIFIVLAIYYDPIEQSHETNSLIYALDIERNRLTLAQNIPTSHASGVQVFKIPSKETHILFTSSGGTEFGKSSVSLLYRFEPKTSKFELLRTFMTGGNRHAKSVSQPKDEFLFIDDLATNSINIYVYNEKWDNFYFYQSLYHASTAPITGIETLYAGEFRRSQVYVIVTTKHDQYFVYEYTYFAKFRIIGQKKTKGILTMVPFDVSSRRYIFVGMETNSTILRVIEQGRN